VFKNVASQKVIVYAFDSTTNLPKTGDAANLTAYVSKDYGAVTVLGDTSATEMDSTNAKGYYLFDLTQGETNGDTLLFSAKSSTANIVVIGSPATVFTNPPNFTSTSIDSNGRVDVIKIAGTTQTARDIGASVLLASGQKVDVDTIKTNPVVNGGTVTFPTNSILASTTNITAGTVTTATNVTTVNGLAANVITATSINADAITAAKIADGAIDAATFAAGAINAAAIAADAITDAKVAADVTIASVTGAVGSVTGNVGGNVVGSVASVTAGVTVTTNNDKTGYALTAGERTSVADALLDRDMSTGTDSGSPTVRTVRQALRFLRNKWSIAAGTLTVTKEDDSTASWTAAVTTNGTTPVDSVDPA
jgi:hypothetical protein